MSTYDRPLVENAFLERLGEGAMHVVANGRRYELKVGLDGVRLYENGEMVGRSGWEALTGFLGHQQRFLAVAGAMHLEPFAVEMPDEEIGEGAVVFDEQELGLRHAMRL